MFSCAFLSLIVHLAQSGFGILFYEVSDNTPLISVSLGCIARARWGGHQSFLSLLVLLKDSKMLLRWNVYWSPYSHLIQFLTCGCSSRALCSGKKVSCY